MLTTRLAATGLSPLRLIPRGSLVPALKRRVNELVAAESHGSRLQRTPNSNISERLQFILTKINSAILLTYIYFINFL